MKLVTSMSKYDRLKKQKEESFQDIQQQSDNLSTLAAESYRVANVAHNAGAIIKDLDRQFAEATKLDVKDISFLFLAIALQCVRIYLIDNLTRIEKAGANNKNETALHELQKKILGRFDKGIVSSAAQYYAPLNQIISILGVPYDATDYEASFRDAFANGKPNLFKGANHRFATIGHDPILGLVFGTANILTNTITIVDQTIPNLLKMKGIDFSWCGVLKSHHVVYNDEFKKPKVSWPCSTIVTIQQIPDRIEAKDTDSVIAALIKQILHIGTDLYTPCGIQIPLANLVLSRANVEKLSTYLDTGDLIKIGMSAGTAALINVIITVLHALTYTDSIPRDLYEVKTRKIILLSNAIASSSNIIYSAFRAYASGNIYKGLQVLDIGGLIIVAHRIASDIRFIEQVKREYLERNWNAIVMGNEGFYSC